MKFAFLGLKKKKGMTQYRAREFVNPVRDWLIGLTCAFVILVCGIAYIAYDFHTQIIEREEGVTVSETPLQYDERAVREQGSRFKEREIIFNRLRSERKEVVYIEKPVVPEEPQSSDEVVVERIEMQ